MSDTIKVDAHSAEIRVDYQSGEYVITFEDGTEERALYSEHATNAALAKLHQLAGADEMALEEGQQNGRARARAQMHFQKAVIHSKGRNPVAVR
jgi:hypothetical protein